MAFNLDTAIRLVGKVQGLNDFKALSERLLDVGKASEGSKAGFQQLSAESGRLAQESVRAAGGARAQAAALQDLGAKTRANASEMRRGSSELRAFGSVLQKLRGQSAGVVDGVGTSAIKAANNIRELGNALTPTDRQLAKVRSEVLALGASTKTTERSIAQQVETLKNLRGQAEVNGRLYRQLTADIDRLKGATQGLDAANTKGVSGFQRLANASRASSAAIDGQIKMLGRLQGRLEKGGEGYRAVGREIDALKAKAAGLDLVKGLSLPSAGGVGGAASSAVGSIRQIVDLRKELAKTNPGRVVLAGEGTAVAGLAGVTGAGLASAMGGLGGGLGGIAGQLDVIASKAAALPGVLKPLGGLLSSPAAAAGDAIANWSSSLNAAQAKLAALSGPFEAIGNAISSIGPETAAAAGAASLAIAVIYDQLQKRAKTAKDEIDTSFREISANARRALQEISAVFEKNPAERIAAQQELRQRNLGRLSEAMPGSLEARRAANAVVSAEREIAKIQGEQNKLLDDARAKQQLKANAAKELLETEKRINEERAKGINQALQQRAQWRQERIDRERAAQLEQRQLALLGRVAEAARRTTTFALPAAGQTSAPGTGQAISGGARRLTGQVETTFGDFQFRNPRAQAFMGRERLPAAAVGVAPSVGFSDQARAALNAQTQATDRARNSLRELFVEVTRSQQASNGSINSLQRQRAAWQALQNAVNPAAPAYERARQNVQRLDEQLKKLTATQEKAAAPQRRGLGREAAGSALGALAAGGGFQGAIGALAGGLAFSGGPAGLAAGAAITAVGATAGLAARVGVDAETAQVRLKALTEQFGEYNQAQASAARIADTLRISQTEASDSFSKLYAALRPTGVTLKEIEDAFIGFTAAARASGATATESSAALLQLKQALGSGVLQGDELRSVREQAPAAAQAIANEMGVTIGELKKLGSEGKITTDIVLRALARLKNENLGKLNAQFDTSAQALQDLNVATENFGKSVARVFGPTAIAGVKAFTEAMNGLTDVVDRFGNPEVAVRNAIRRGRLPPNLDQAAEIFKGSSGTGGVGLTGLIKEARELSKIRRQPYTQVIAELMRDRLDRIENTPDSPSATQKAEQDAAARERAAARVRAEQAQNKETTDKKAKAEESAIDKQTDIRLDAEKRIAEFREQSLERASQFERDLADQRLELERSTAEARRRLQAQQEDATLERERQRLRSLGLGTEAIDLQERLNESRRRLIEDTIRIEQDATDRRVQLERSIEEYKVSVAEGIRSILIDAGERMAEAMQGGAKRAAGIVGGVIARTGNTGQSTGPHLDARWADGRPITAAQVDRYLMVNGRTPSSYGVTSPYGPRNLFGRSFHSGVDLGTPAGSQITLRNGAQLLRNLGNTGAGGYAIEIMTAEGPMRLLHLQAGSAGTPGAVASTRSVAALAAPGESPGLDRVRAAGERLQQSIGTNAQVTRSERLQAFITETGRDFGGIKQQLDGQLKSVRDQRTEFERMIELQRSGLSPEIARQRVENERIAEIERRNLETLELQLLKDLSIGDLTDQQRQDLQAILSSVRERQAAQDGIVQGLTDEAVALEALRETYERNRQLAEGIANTIGQGIGNAFDVLINGTDDWGDSLREIASGVLKDIANQLIQVAVVQPIIKSITGAFGFANGGIMTDQGPLPLRTYARGGIANSPQLALFGEGQKPEAYVPLPDGRRIPVAMQNAPGGTAAPAQSVTVNVAVDAKGSQVQGNQPQGAALGRAIAAAVQAEIVKQQRPGGLLTQTA